MTKTETETETETEIETRGNLDGRTVDAFAREWQRFDQSQIDPSELRTMFEEYFALFPWASLPPDARGADIGCGTGRWARFVAPRVSELHCVDASRDVVDVARSNLRDVGNVRLHQASVDNLPFADGSLDFAYSLGVLHHVPDPARALEACVRTLKPGAPFLVYLYYALDNRPVWYRALWRMTDLARKLIVTLPPVLQDGICDLAALTLYWPLARIARIGEMAGLDVSRFPLSVYRHRSLYSMRTDARDRFGTPLERRFTAQQVHELLGRAGLGAVRLGDEPPFWCAVGIKT